MFFILCYTVSKIRHKKVCEKENKKMAKAQRYTMAAILSAQKMLRGLTDKAAGKTRKEVVEFLEKDIVKALEQGHSLQDIRDILAKAGIAAPLSRMKDLLGQSDEKQAQTEDAPVPETKVGTMSETVVTAPHDTGKDAEALGVKKSSLFEL
jgi:hypothetical protein